MIQKKYPSVLVTGASGFLGKNICSNLEASSCYVRSVFRHENSIPNDVSFADSIIVGEIDSQTNWRNVLRGIEVIIHTAARVHIMNDNNPDPYQEYYEINVEGTLNLAQQAVQAGIKRFIFISSIKVNGEETIYKSHFTPEDNPHPSDPYSVSKYEAEKELLKISQKTGIDVVIIRAPLIYGPGVKGNFLKLMNILYKKTPLPLGLIKDNARSLVALDNLVDLIKVCLDHPKAANEIFLVSDDLDMSTTELLSKMSKALGVNLYLLPIPDKVLRVFASLLGKSDIYHRLCGSLRVDISKTKELLGWKPPYTVDEVLVNTANYYLK
ncbi:UDP-glucose 4-epimerase family protein [Zooshikella sp. RANM57]|uniref:UDP-glucose 4-epimerase family protein n=1 Tax=Zooshikella sp. RANM57 TaxID=3425863 RepID=UPI003D6E521A